MSDSENVAEEIVKNEIKVEEKEIKVEEKVKEESRKKHNKLPIEGSGSLELNLYKGPKTWKKSITQFFRNQLRSTRSNDGDGPSGSNEQFPEADISPEQKWQSLGKMFRRPHLDTWSKDGSTDDHPQKKTVALKKVLSSYFGKNSKTLPPVADEK